MTNFFFALVFVFSMTITAKANSEIIKTFEKFQQNFGKTYTSEEELNKRLAIFSKNMRHISNMNAKHVLSSEEAVFGITKFSDLTSEEFNKAYLTYQSRKTNPGKNVAFGSLIPDVIDWVAQGAVNPPTTAGSLGGEIYPLVSSIEGAAKVSGKHPLGFLSTQQLGDCSNTDLPALQEYVVKNGMESAAGYKHGTPCGYDASRVAVKVQRFEQIKTGEANLKNATAFRPVMVCLAASSFQTYRGGILTKCDDVVNHCLELIGYDFSSTQPYWRLQNSWGTNWGESGYIRIATGSNLCKISDYASYAVV